MTKLQTGRIVLKIICLMTTALVMVGCVPHPQPELTATKLPTGTVVPVATNTATLIPTKTEAPSLTPTPEGVDYSQAFFDPQSEADFLKVIESPSPIDDPVDYAKWDVGYLAAVNAKLATWTGASITFGGGLIFQGGEQ